MSNHEPHAHVYKTVDGEKKYHCFFLDEGEANAWVGKQEDPTLYEVTMTPPPKRQATA